ELAREPLVLEEGADRVDPVRGHEGRALSPLGEEVAQRAVHRARQAHRVALPRDEREGAVDLPDAAGNAAGDPGARLFHSHVVNAIDGGIDEIHYLLDWPVDHRTPPPPPTLHNPTFP